jgi:hypothetical protein
LANR